MSEEMESTGEKPEFVYRISTAEEWHELHTTGSTFGGNLDKSSRYIHLSHLHQVKTTLNTFFWGIKDLYLLQIDTKKLGDGLVYETAKESSDIFPHFYGPSGSYSPLPLDAVNKTEKLTLVGDEFSCSLLE